MSLSLQQQADACGALLILQEFIGAGLVTINGKLDTELTRSKLQYLEARGIVPNPDVDKLAALAAGLAIEMGYKLR